MASIPSKRPNVRLTFAPEVRGQDGRFDGTYAVLVENRGAPKWESTTGGIYPRDRKDTDPIPGEVEVGHRVDDKLPPDSFTLRPHHGKQWSLEPVVRGPGATTVAVVARLYLGDGTVVTSNSIEIPVNEPGIPGTGTID